FFMTRTVQHDHGQVFDIASQPARDVFQIVFHRSIDIDNAARRRANHDLVHVNIRRVQQTTAFCSGEYGDRVVGAESAEVCAFERVDRNVDLGARFSDFIADAESAANFLADVEHWSFIAFAFADHHASTHGNRVHYFPHRLDGYVIGKLPVALTHGSGGSYRRGFGYAQEIQRQLALCSEIVTHLLLLFRNHAEMLVHTSKNHPQITQNMVGSLVSDML